MSKNRWVNTKFWGDNYVIDLDPSEKLVFLYCLTNDQTSLCGAYEINLRTVALETGFDREMLLKIFARFERDDKIAYRDGHVIVRNFRRHQADNPKIRQGIEREEKLLPEHIKDSLSIGFERLGSTINTLPIPKPIPKPIPIGKDAAGAPEAERTTNETYAYWEREIGEITTTRETQRKACSALQNKYGLEACQKAIRIVAAAHADRYARKEAKCLTPAALQNNWDKVLIYAKAKFTQQQPVIYDAS